MSHELRGDGTEEDHQPVEALREYIQIISGHDDIQQSMESGADEYLPKPFKGAEVRARIHDQLHPGE